MNFTKSSVGMAIQSTWGRARGKGVTQIRSTTTALEQLSDQQLMEGAVLLRINPQHLITER